MSDTSPYGFELVRRGYDRAQVDERISKLVSDRDSALARITALEKRIEELHLETQNAQAQVSDAEPSYAGLGARVEKILRLAEEEAKDLREEARRASEQHRELAESAAQQVRNDAESFAADRKSKAEDEGVRIVEKAKGDASTLRAEAGVRRLGVAHLGLGVLRLEVQLLDPLFQRVDTSKGAVAVGDQLGNAVVHLTAVVTTPHELEAEGGGSVAHGVPVE